MTLAGADHALLAELLEDAWERKAPVRLTRARDHSRGGGPGPGSGPG